MSWKRALTAIAAALSFAAPLPAQLGLASSPRPLQLTAVKHGWVSISLPAIDPAPRSTSLSAGIAAAWNVPAEQSTRLTLVAHLASGRLVPRSAVLYTGAITGDHALGGRTEALQVEVDSTMSPGPTPGTHTGTLTLVVVTQ